MRAVRPYLSAGVALLGATVIAITAAPAVGPAAQGRTSNHEVALAALSAPSPLYIPQNLINGFLSIPAWEIQAMDRFADAMIATGSWQVWGPTNVLGFDEQDPPKLQASIDMLIPFQPFSSALGEDLSWWARANLPMNPGCAALPGACPDLDALLDGMFQVPLSQLYGGYTFPTVTNPFTGEETSWSGQYVQLQPWNPVTSSWEWLVAPPRPVETVSPVDALATAQKFTTAVFAAYYPFVQNSEWYNDEQTDLAPFFRALAPTLCPSCDPDNPYDNPWLYENYPPNVTAEDTLSVTDPADPSAAKTTAVPAWSADPGGADAVSDAVQGLVTTFESPGAGRWRAEQAVETDPGDGGPSVPKGAADTSTDDVTQSRDTDAVDRDAAARESKTYTGEGSESTHGRRSSDTDDSTSENSKNSAAAEQAGSGRADAGGGAENGSGNRSDRSGPDRPQ